MISRSPKLLCVGTDPLLLRTRCDVLARNGFDAQAAALSEAEFLLHSGSYDLVIISAGLPDCELQRLMSTADGTPAHVLTELTLAAELLDQVKGQLTLRRFKVSAATSVNPSLEATGSD